MATALAESATTKTIRELRRCIERLAAYELVVAKNVGLPYEQRANTGLAHAAAHRATLDAWRMLAWWRRNTP